MLQGMCIWLPVYQTSRINYVLIPMVSQFLTIIVTNFSKKCFYFLLFKYLHSNVTFCTRPFYRNECLVNFASKPVLYHSSLIQMVWQLCTLYSCERLFFLCYRAVTDSINMLLNACMSAAPGQKECDNALRNIQVWFQVSVGRHKKSSKKRVKWEWNVLPLLFMNTILITSIKQTHISITWLIFWLLPEKRCLATTLLSLTFSVLLCRLSVTSWTILLNLLTTTHSSTVWIKSLASLK